MPRETVKMDKESVEPPQPKKKRLSLSRRKNNNPDRFVTVSKESLEEMSTMKMPKISELNCKWAINNLSDWRENYNLKNVDNPCSPETFLLGILLKQ